MTSGGREGRGRSGGRRGRLAAALLGVALALAPAAAGAASITSSGIVTPSPGNDDAGADNPNLVEVAGFVSSLDPVDLVLTATNSGATTEYRFVVSATNDSPAEWTSFRLQLGTGVGSGFTPVGVDELDFDMPDQTPNPTGGVFASVEHTPGALEFGDGTVPMIFGTVFVFAVDVPDTADPSGAYSFTLRLAPGAAVPVPLPAALVLVGAPLLGCAALSFRHACRRAR